MPNKIHQKPVIKTVPVYFIKGQIAYYGSFQNKQYAIKWAEAMEARGLPCKVVLKYVVLK